MKWYQWFFIVLGLWLVVSPWFLGFSSLNLALWNNIVVGAIIILVVFWSISPPSGS
jgi:hypothetical protein